MHFSRLQKASNLKVAGWLRNSMSNLTDYQKAEIWELLDRTPFYFYEKTPPPKTVWWIRITILAIPVYVILVWIILLLKWLTTGDRYLPQKYIDTVHNPWMRLLNIKL